MRRNFLLIALLLSTTLTLENIELSRRHHRATDATAHATTNTTNPGGNTLSANAVPKLQAGIHLANHTGNAYQYVLELFASLPNGTSLDQAQFDTALGADTAAFLRSLNVTHIDSHNNSVKVTLSSVYDTTVPSAEIRLDQAVSFTFAVNASDTLICDNIAGIEVRAAWLLGWMPVHHVEVSHDTAGNTIIEVEVSSVLGTIKRTIKLDPKGNAAP